MLTYSLKWSPHIFHVHLGISNDIEIILVILVKLVAGVVQW